MNKTRMEAFSDGIFAIAITILILEIKIPNVEPDKLFDAFVSQGHKLFAYVLSFIIIGMYWIAHHYMIHLIKNIDRNSLWLNTLNLMFICFLPYPTGLLGEYPDSQFAVFLYASSLSCVNITGTLFWFYSASLNENKASISKGYRNYVAILHLSPMVLYVFAMLLSLIKIELSYFVFILVPLFFIIPNRIVLRDPNSFDGKFK